MSLGFWAESVFVRQQERRHAAVGFRDDPDLTPVLSYSGKNLQAMFEAEFVFKAVVFVELPQSPETCLTRKASGSSPLAEMRLTLQASPRPYRG